LLATWLLCGRHDKNTCRRHIVGTQIQCVKICCDRLDVVDFQLDVVA
jgi:hypothetical protein